MEVVKKNARIAHEVHVKAKLNELYDFDHFTKIQRKIIDDLGCTACTSGVNLRFDIERYFGEFENHELDRIKERESASDVIDVRVIASKAIANNFETNVAARRAVLKELGCEPCTSGYNILFEDELAFAVNQKAEVIKLA